MSNVSLIPTKAAAEAAHAALAAHDQQLLADASLLNQPEWQAERKRLQNIFYDVFMRWCDADHTNVVPFRRRG